MDIIPVIDLLDGHAVHAQRGDRQHYRPLKSSLCHSSEPLVVVRALLELYRFEQLYIADLNGIQKRGNHYEIIAEIQMLYPQLKLWLDAGVGRAEDLHEWQGLELDWVIGSESLCDMSAYFDLKQDCGNNCLLSLDFHPHGYQGPNALLQQTEYWPNRVIAMTLNQVGSNLGPDEKTLATLLQRRPAQKIYAAGGIRNIDDIIQLNQMHVAGILIAGALHNGSITSRDIVRIAAL